MNWRPKVPQCVGVWGLGAEWVVSAMRYRALVSRLATFGALIACRARACASPTCAYVAERDGYRPGSRLKVAHSDTTRGASWRPILRPRAAGVLGWVGVSGLGLLLRRR